MSNGVNHDASFSFQIPTEFGDDLLHGNDDFLKGTTFILDTPRAPRAKHPPLTLNELTPRPRVKHAKVESNSQELVPETFESRSPLLSLPVNPSAPRGHVEPPLASTDTISPSHPHSIPEPTIPSGFTVPPVPATDSENPSTATTRRTLGAASKRKPVSGPGLRDKQVHVSLLTLQLAFLSEFVLILGAEDN